MVGEERTKFILKNSMFVVICGSNDIANDFFGLPTVRLQYTVDSFTALMADNARSFAKVNSINVISDIFRNLFQNCILIFFVFHMVLVVTLRIWSKKNTYVWCTTNRMCSFAENCSRRTYKRLCC